MYNIECRKSHATAGRDGYTEKYSRGRRGAPAKGVGRLSRRESSNLSFSARKRLRIGYNSESFSTKSTLSGGLNRIHDEIPLAWDEIRLDGGWVDLISSKLCLDFICHRQISSRSDFILAFVSNLCYTCSKRWLLWQKTSLQIYLWILRSKY